MSIKDLLRKTLVFLHIDLTKNLEYDRLTQAVFKKVLRKDSNIIDVGAHKGEILDMALSFSPTGTHYAFEPIPALNAGLTKSYDESRVKIYPYALAEENGTSVFNYVKNAPAYSGIKKRKYHVENPDIEEIKVELKRLDDVIPVDVKIDLIKIDVEGAELGVLKGAKETLKRNKPVLVFECGLGASEFYGTIPQAVYQLIQEVGLSVYTLKAFMKNQKKLSEEEFTALFESNKEYYFVAAKVQAST